MERAGWGGHERYSGADHETDLRGGHATHLEEVSVGDPQQTWKVGRSGGRVAWRCHGLEVRVVYGEVGSEVCTVGQRADQGY